MAYDCPTCDGTGTRRDTRNRISGLAVVVTACELCDGAGVLHVPLHTLALRFKRQVRTMINNRREGAIEGGNSNG